MRSADLTDERLRWDFRLYHIKYKRLVQMMDKYGYVRVAAASPELRVADCEFNKEKIIGMIRRAETEQVEFLVFPELCITGYTCAELFKQTILQESAVKALEEIAESTRGSLMVVIVGLPLNVKGRLFNCAAVIQDGKVLGIVAKTYIPEYNEFYEQRWFSGADDLDTGEIKICGSTVPIGNDLIFECDSDENFCFGIEICEDLWVTVSPSGFLAQAGAVLLFNLSASNECVGKAEYRLSLVKNQSARCVAGYVYASSNPCESTTDMVFGGHNIIAENGTLAAQSERFIHAGSFISYDIDVAGLLSYRSGIGTYRACHNAVCYRKVLFRANPVSHDTLRRRIDRHPFVPQDPAQRAERCHEVLSIQTTGLATRMKRTGLTRPVIGISGGLDSTLALIVTVRAMKQLGLPPEQIIAVTMPGFGTTGRTYGNAVELIKSFGAGFREVSIKESCLQHFRDIGHNPDVHDVTYENAQARERMQILMDLANKYNGLVIGTGDMSELALGWCTYNGDHMSMYAVNAGVPKTLIRYILGWYAENEAQGRVKDILLDIMDTPISPELLPPSETGKIVQKTEEVLGPYEVHDFFLYHVVRWGAPPAKVLMLARHAFSGTYSEEQLLAWLKVFYRRFFTQQFKRSCMPDGPKVGTISLSPRGDWRMPSDASPNLWLNELEVIGK